MTEALSFSIQEILPYINWSYFFHSWKLRKVSACSVGAKQEPYKEQGEGRQTLPAKEEEDVACGLYQDTLSLIEKIKDSYHTYALYGLFPARSQEDDVLIRDANGNVHVIPFLRQQRNREGKGFLCLSDFINPSRSFCDKIGIFACTVDARLTELCADDPYESLLLQTLCDRFAEATSEKMHEYVRKDVWSYAKMEKLSPEELFAEKYQGIRPAIGYPSLPDQSLVFLLDDILQFSRIHLSVSETGGLMPHASVCGLMFSHPSSCYFSVGSIDEVQLKDYAIRRGLPVECIRHFLEKNLSSIS